MIIIIFTITSFTIIIITIITVTIIIIIIIISMFVIIIRDAGSEILPRRVSSPREPEGSPSV